MLRAYLNLFALVNNTRSCSIGNAYCFTGRTDAGKQDLLYFSTTKNAFFTTGRLPFTTLKNNGSNAGATCREQYFFFNALNV